MLAGQDAAIARDAAPAKQLKPADGAKRSPREAEGDDQRAVFDRAGYDAGANINTTISTSISSAQDTFAADQAEAAIAGALHGLRLSADAKGPPADASDRADASKDPSAHNYAAAAAAGGRRTTLPPQPQPRAPSVPRAVDVAVAASKRPDVRPRRSESYEKRPAEPPAFKSKPRPLPKSSSRLTVEKVIVQTTTTGEQVVKRTVETLDSSADADADLSRPTARSSGTDEWRPRRPLLPRAQSQPRSFYPQPPPQQMGSYVQQESVPQEPQTEQKPAEQQQEQEAEQPAEQQQEQPAPEPQQRRGYLASKGPRSESYHEGGRRLPFQGGGRSPSLDRFSDGGYGNTYTSNQDFYSYNNNSAHARGFRQYDGRRPPSRSTDGGYRPRSESARPSHRAQYSHQQFNSYSNSGNYGGGFYQGKQHQHHQQQFHGHGRSNFHNGNNNRRRNNFNNNNNFHSGYSTHSNYHSNYHNQQQFAPPPFVPADPADAYHPVYSPTGQLLMVNAQGYVIPAIGDAYMGYGFPPPMYPPPFYAPPPPPPPQHVLDMAAAAGMPPPPPPAFYEAAPAGGPAVAPSVAEATAIEQGDADAVAAAAEQPETPEQDGSAAQSAAADVGVSEHEIQAAGAECADDQDFAATAADDAANGAVAAAAE